MKRAYVLMTPEVVADLCKPQEKIITSIKSEVPVDAIFITAEYSDSLQCFRVIFEHDSFDDISEGNRIPRIDPPEFTKYFYEG